MRQRRFIFKHWLAAMAAALLVWTLVAWVGARWLIVQAPLDHADAIMVLGGSATYKERTGLAARLFHEGRAPVVVLSDDGGRAGWSRREQRNPPFVDLAQAELVRLGVPESAIVTLPQTVGSTEEEAAAIRAFAVAHSWRTVLVVTSAYHSRRALRTLRDEMESAVQIGLVSPPPGEQTPRPAIWWLTLRGWPMVAGEYVKMAYYWKYYWK